MRMGGSAISASSSPYWRRLSWRWRANQTRHGDPSDAFVTEGRDRERRRDGHMDQQRRDPQRRASMTGRSMSRPTRVASLCRRRVTTFPTVGTFRYFCECPRPEHVRHRHRAGSRAAPRLDPVAAAGAAARASPSAPTRSHPDLKLSGQRRQDVLARRAVLVTVAVNEASAVSAKGTVSVPGQSKVFRLRKASRDLKAGAKATLKLKLPSRHRVRSGARSRGGPS